VLNRFFCFSKNNHDPNSGKHICMPQRGKETYKKKPFRMVRNPGFSDEKNIFRVRSSIE